jgi:ribosome biogenesis protein YTM1
MDIDGDVDEASRTVQVRFTTKLKAPFKAPSTAIAIPSNLTRLGLSAVVNNLLKAGNGDWTSEPFDFLIEGELIRMSLEQFLLAKGISAERVLEIEYIKAVVPRKEEEPSLHDDWVSAIDGSHPGFILTGCYDGLGRIWKGAGSCTHILEGHGAAITSVSIINSKEAESGSDVLVATGSKDRTLRLWMLDANDSAVDSSTKVTAFRTLRGHSAAVQSIASQASGNLICSGSWDSRINIWDTKASDTGGDIVSAKKRRKDGEVEESQSVGEAASTLVGHTQCVSSVAWPERGTIYSASWDHSIRRWDVETGKDSLNMFCGKAFNSLDVGGESSALVAAGCSDPILRIWDPRKPGTSAPIYNFSSHTSWISACKWHDKSWFHLLSSSYDGKVMLWDLRTAWPLAVIDSHKDKVLCADWWKGDSVVSGGADSQLRISSQVSV